MKKASLVIKEIQEGSYNDILKVSILMKIVLKNNLKDM